MKFWELMSIMRGEEQAVIGVASSNEEWRHYRQWARDFEVLVSTQRRDTLDTLVDNDFAGSVLKQSGKRLFLGRDGWLRSYRFSTSDVELTLAMAFAEYGGTAVEDAFEKGSFEVGRRP